MTTTAPTGDLVVVRPTEAQLRWAQFHHKRRAVGVREAVERMHQTPEKLEDVSGALPEDGGSSTSACSAVQRRRPNISRGRRAFIRISRRAYEKRKDGIERNGYKVRRDSTTPQKEENEAEYVSEDEEEEALNEIFMTRRRRRRRKRGAGDDGGYKRFQAACHAMMMNLQAPPKHSILMPAKKWTRTEEHIAAASLYDQYLDPKWGVRRPIAQPSEGVQSQYNNPSFMPIDRGATWLMHLPKATHAAREIPYYYNPAVLPPASVVGSDGPSEHSEATLAMQAPGQQKFSQLVDLVQQRMIKRSLEQQLKKPTDVAPTMRLRQFSPTGAGAEEYYDDEVDNSNQPMHHRERERKSNYVPRMRLRDFVTDRSSIQAVEEGIEEYDDEANELTTGDSQHGIPKMRLREFSETAAGKSQAETRQVSRTREIAMSLEAENSNKTNDVSKTMRIAQSLSQEAGRNNEKKRLSKTRQMAQSFEGPKEAPKMRLRDLSMGSHATYGGDEEKKMADESGPPRRKPHPMSEKYLQADPSAAVSPNRVETPTGSARVSDYFGKLRQERGLVDTPPEAEKPAAAAATVTAAPATTPPRNGAGSGASDDGTNRVSDFFGQLRQLNAGNALQASTNRVSDFFAQVRQINASESVNEKGMTSGASSTGASQGSADDVESPGKRNLFVKTVDEDSSNHDMEDDILREDGFDEETDGKQKMYGSVTPLGSESMKVFDHTVSLEAEHRPTRGSRNSGKLFGNADFSWEGGDDTRSESDTADLWSKGRKSFNAFAMTLQSISESKNQAYTPKSSATSPANLKERASNMSGKVGGFMNMFTGGPDEGGDPNNHHHDDESALLAYRKNRESLSPDDTLSVSSYHVLPDVIRDAVQKMSLSSTGASRSSGMSPDRSTLSSFKDSSPSERMSHVYDTRSTFSRSSVGHTNRSTLSRSSVENMSPEKYKQAHDNVFKNSALLGGDVERAKSIIDTDNVSDSSEEQTSPAVPGVLPASLANLMLSPDVLMKRLHQAIQAVEERRWEQVHYLLNANPWLAEMSEPTTKQYLLHKLSFFGAGDGAAPEDLCLQLIDLFPSAVHKFDLDGNVPLHLAAAAGHLKMIKILGEKFESGASIRNEDGMLPLHFTIAAYGGVNAASSYGDDVQDDDDENPSPVRVIKTVLKFFTKAVAIADNDGNLPIHVAVECLDGGVGVDVIYLLLDEADRQLQDPEGARFHNRVKLEDLVNDDMSATTMSTQRETDSVNADGDDTQCNMVKNEFGETPLLVSIRGNKGWEMVEAIVRGPGGRMAATAVDANKNNSLHLLVSEYEDPAAAMSILKLAPETASKRNSEGMLPIETACLQMMPPEVILAIALVDLPIDVDDKDGIKIREGAGGSWWFLACECDDHYINIVQEILSICTFQQIRALCFMKGGSSHSVATVISRATPKCQLLLTQSLRFVGRFEFVGNAALYTDPSIGLKEFDALDFGGNKTAPDPQEEGRRVLLKCYSMQEPFLKETATLRGIPLDPHFVEEVLTFAVNDGQGENGEAAQQYCMSIERPQVTMDRVVDGMIKNGSYRHDPQLRKKYAAKVCSVLRLIAKALRHLHESGMVHGDVCLERCGRFDNSWKLLSRTGIQIIGEPFDQSRFHQSFPPEALFYDENVNNDTAVYDSDYAPVGFKHTLITDVSLDMWGFGKLAYEALTGSQLIAFDDTKEPQHDVASMIDVLEWNESHMKNVFSNLLDCGLTEDGADVITSCLYARPEDRPESMDDILSNPFWKDMRQFRDRTSSSGRSSASASVSTSSLSTRRYDDNNNNNNDASTKTRTPPRRRRRQQQQQHKFDDENAPASTTNVHYSGSMFTEEMEI